MESQEEYNTDVKYEPQSDDSGSESDSSINGYLGRVPNSDGSESDGENFESIPELDPDYEFDLYGCIISVREIINALESSPENLLKDEICILDVNKDNFSFSRKESLLRLENKKIRIYSIAHSKTASGRNQNERYGDITNLSEIYGKDKFDLIVSKALRLTGNPIEAICKAYDTLKVGGIMILDGLTSIDFTNSHIVVEYLKAQGYEIISSRESEVIDNFFIKKTVNKPTLSFPLQLNKEIQNYKSTDDLEKYKKCYVSNDYEVGAELALTKAAQIDKQLLNRCDDLLTLLSDDSYKSLTANQQYIFILAIVVKEIMLETENKYGEVEYVDRSTAEEKVKSGEYEIVDEKSETQFGSKDYYENDLMIMLDELHEKYRLGSLCQYARRTITMDRILFTLVTLSDLYMKPPVFKETYINTFTMEVYTESKKEIAGIFLRLVLFAGIKDIKQFSKLCITHTLEKFGLPYKESQERKPSSWVKEIKFDILQILNEASLDLDLETKMKL